MHMSRTPFDGAPSRRSATLPSPAAGALRIAVAMAAAWITLAPSGASAADRQPEAAVAARTVPPIDVLSSAGEGRRRWLGLNCYSCHGMFAAGGMGPNIIGAERGDVREAVLFGKDEGMPSYRAMVSDADITFLSDYLRSIGTPSEPFFMDWWKKIPPK